MRKINISKVCETIRSIRETLLLASMLWMNVTRQDDSMERANRFGGTNFIVQEKKFLLQWEIWVRIVRYHYHNTSFIKLNKNIKRNNVCVISAEYFHANGTHNKIH